jgi:hypothetical protein
MSTSPSSATKPVNGKTHEKNSRQQQQSRKRKVARARRPRGEFESDDELERAVDAGSDSDSQHSDGSVTESESEVSELEDGTSLRSGHEQASSPPTPVGAAPKPPESPSQRPVTLNWSDAVQESLTGDAGDLPVIDFNDFKIDSVASEDTPRSPEPAKQPSTSQPLKQSHSPSRQKPHPSPLRPPTRPSARQAYQERLTNDPSFVPVVGEFWGHDDRLMDKELRSLSGWWRGRWQGRGRGGFARGWGHGRGGPPMRGRFAPAPEQREDLLPVDKPWSHDGYEELSKTEDRRRFAPSRRGWGGNKATSNFPHKRSNPSTLASDSRPRTPVNPTARAQAQAVAQGRPWFAKKPERIWTKQFDGFLYVDPELKSGGKGQSIRVRIKPGTSTIVPLSDSLRTQSRSTAQPSQVEPFGPLVIRLPGQRSQIVEEKRSPTHSLQVEPAITYEELHLAPMADHYHEHPRPVPMQPAGYPNGPLSQVVQPAMEADVPANHTDAFEGAYPPAFQPSIEGTPEALPFSSPIYYNPAFDFGSPSPGLYFGDVGYPDPHLRTSFYMQPSPQNPYGRHPSHAQVLGQPEMVPYHPIHPEYVVYPDAQALQFSLPRRSAKVEIRAPKELERAVLLNPESSILQSSAEQGDQRLPNPPYYPAIGPTNLAAPSGPDERVNHTVPYGEVHYYNPYGYSYMNPYEGYNDGRRVYY